MASNYREALTTELGLWQSLQTLLHSQRQAIIRRDSPQVWDAQQQMRDLMSEVLLAGHETIRLRPLQPDATMAALERETATLRHEVRDDVRLNNALLQDICRYLELIGSSHMPGALPAPASPPRVIGSIHHGTETSQVA